MVVLIVPRTSALLTSAPTVNLLSKLKIGQDGQFPA